MKRTLSRICAAWLLVTAAGTAHATLCTDPDPLRVAAIPQTTGQAMAGHYDGLVAALSDELDRDVVLLTVGSYGAVIEGLYDGSIDLAELGPGSYALARDRGTDISAFAALRKKGDAEGPADYRSVLISRRDSGMKTLEDLKGAAVSLIDPASTSGGIVPRAWMPRLTGLPLESWFGRVTFAGSHDAAINAVLEGRVAAAFVSDTWVESASHRGRPAADVLHVVWHSEPIPTDPFVYQNRLCEPVKQAIHRVFFERQAELQALFDWRDREGFVPASDSDYQQLMQKVVGDDHDAKGR